MNTTWYESEGQYYIPAEQTTRYQYTFFKEFICPVFREFPQTHKMQWPLHLGILGRDSKAKRKDLCFRLECIGDVDFNEENWYQRWKLLFQICNLFHLPFDLFLLLQNCLCSIKPSFQLQESVVPGFYVHNTEESDSEDSIYDPNEGEVVIGGDVSPIHSLLDFIRSLPRS
jgi:hypothetical protein